MIAPKDLLRRTIPWLALMALVAALPQWTDAGEKPAALGANAAKAAGPEKRVVAFGDKCAVDYSCRLEDGSLLITTRKSVADDPKVAKSDIFFELNEYNPISLLAGVDNVNAKPNAVPSTLGLVDKKLSEAIVGLETGKEAELALTAGKIERGDGTTGEVRMKLLRVRPIEREMSMTLFKRHSQGKEPVVGMAIQLEPSGLNWFEGDDGLMGRVIAVAGDAVKVRYAVEPGDTFRTTFGSATVERFRDDGKMEIRLHPEVGKVLRFQYNLARITKIDDRAFTVDMDYPFGGDTLQCQVVVREADPDSPEKQAMLKSMQLQLGQVLERRAAAEKTAAQGELADIVQSGDLAWVRYTITDEKGLVGQGSAPAGDGTAKTDSAVTSPDQAVPAYPVVAGRPGDVPELDMAVIGMHLGERKHLVLPPEKGYGPRDEKRVIAFDRVREVPLKTSLPRVQFNRQFDIQPEKGAQFDMPPYGRATIDTVTDQEVSFTLRPDLTPMQHDYGTTEVRVDKDKVLYTLTPRIGAQFSYEGKTGAIVATSDKKFTVDFNHPLAGRPVSLDLEVRDFKKASVLAGTSLHWTEDFEAAGTLAKKEDKPMAVMLYADWCAWCKRMFSETLTDPVIAAMADRFVWVKVNSDKNKEFMTRFGQKGFPMMVLLDQQGRVIEKRQGFQQVYPLYEALRHALESKKG